MPVLDFLWEVVKTGAGLFAAPFRNPDMLWIIIPVYLGWFFAEFFQEKRGTSLGNAISNGIIPFWVGADWARTTLRLRAEHAIAINATFFAKMVMSVVMVVYGFFIIFEGIKARRATHFVGRIRVVTYFVIVLTPLFYDVIMPSQYLYAILGIILYFPIFYFLIEFIDHVTPDNAAIREETGGSSSQPTKDIRFDEELKTVPIVPMQQMQPMQPMQPPMQQWQPVQPPMQQPFPPPPMPPPQFAAPQQPPPAQYDPFTRRFVPPRF